jgi:hypothetical protein
MPEYSLDVAMALMCVVQGFCGTRLGCSKARESMHLDISNRPSVSLRVIAADMMDDLICRWRGHLIKETCFAQSVWRLCRASMYGDAKVKSALGLVVLLQLHILGIWICRKESWGRCFNNGD